MTIMSLMEQLDMLILSKFGRLDKVLESPEGKLIIKRLLAEENRSELREWFAGPLTNRNSLACEIQRILEGKLES